MTDRAAFTVKMNEMVEIAGLTPDAVLVLTRERGGTKLNVPAKAPDGHWLVHLIGRDNADKLCAYYGREEIEVPLGPNATAIQRREQMRRLDREGLSYGQIALRVGVDRRTVIRHVKGTSNRPKNADQADMFLDHHPRPRRT